MRRTSTSAPVSITGFTGRSAGTGVLAWACRRACPELGRRVAKSLVPVIRRVFDLLECGAPVHAEQVDEVQVGADEYHRLAHVSVEVLHDHAVRADRDVD